MAKIKEHWKKTSPFGDYLKTPDRLNAKKNKQTMVIREARALYVTGKHTGSKPVNKLLQGIAKAHEAQSAAKKAEEIKENNNE